MSYTPAQIINIAKAAQFLSAQDVAKGALYGTRKIPDTPRILYMERMALEWMYNLDPTEPSLQQVANYVYSLCRGYNLAASSISGSGGSITPVNVSGAPDPLDFTVADTNTPMVTGQSILFIDGTNGNPDMRGYEVLFSRGGIVQSRNNVGGTYYTWNSFTGKFEVFGAANLEEQFLIQPTI